MYIGEEQITKLYMGSDEVEKIYLGTEIVYDGGGSNTHYFSGTATPNSSFNVSIFNGDTYESISFSSDASGNWEFTYSGNFEDMNGLQYNSDIRTVDLTYMNHNIIGNAFQNCQNLSSVTIPNYVTEIGSNAFQNCNLQNVYIPDSVTIIENQAFYNNSSLSDIHIGSGITELGVQAFYTNSIIQRVEILATTPPTIDSNYLPFPPGIVIYVPCDPDDTTLSDYQTAWGNSYTFDCFTPPSPLNNAFAIKVNGTWIEYQPSDISNFSTTGMYIDDLESTMFEYSPSDVEELVIGNEVESINLDGGSWDNCYGLTLADTVTGSTDIHNFPSMCWVHILASSFDINDMGSGAFSDMNCCQIYVPNAYYNVYLTDWDGVSDNDCGGYLTNRLAIDSNLDPINCHCDPNYPDYDECACEGTNCPEPINSAFAVLINGDWIRYESSDVEYLSSNEIAMFNIESTLYLGGYSTSDVEELIIGDEITTAMISTFGNGWSGCTGITFADTVTGSGSSVNGFSSASWVRLMGSSFPANNGSQFSNMNCCQIYVPSAYYNDYLSDWSGAYDYSCGGGDLTARLVSDANWPPTQ